MHTIRNALALMGLLSGAAVALADSETRDLAGFDAIVVSGGIDLTLQQGSDFNVQVTADEGELAEIITEVRNNTLYIGRDWPDERRGWRAWRERDWNADYSADITLPALRSLEASGGSDVMTADTFTGERFTLRVSGGSGVVLALEVDTLRVDASGGADVELSGSTDRLRAESSGGSEMDASDLIAREVDIHSSGGSDARVAVTESLTADASGGSDIYYSGAPQYKDIDTSGSGDVRHR